MLRNPPADPDDFLICVFNFTPKPPYGTSGRPRAGVYRSC